MPGPGFDPDRHEANRGKLAFLEVSVYPMANFIVRACSHAETFILNHVYQELPEPPYTSDAKAQVAQLVYRHIWQQSVRDQLSRDSGRTLR